MNVERLHIFTHQVPIRWRDIDPYNVVNHSIFFTYMEEARWHWFHNLNLKEEVTIITPMVDAQISFKKPLKYPDTAIIKIYAEPPGEKNWTIYHEIFSEKYANMLCAEASVKFVSFDPKISRVVPIPLEFKAHLYPLNSST